MKITITLDVPDGTTVDTIYVPPNDESIPLPPDAIALPTDGAILGQPPVFRGAAQHAPLTSGPAQVWQIGQVHEPGHQPLKAGNKGGLFCPSKVGQNPDGSAVWCRFRA